MKTILLLLSFVLPASALAQGFAPPTALPGTAGVAGNQSARGEITIDLSVTGCPYTLHPGEWWQGQIIFVGALTSDCTVTLPAQSGQDYDLYQLTTGSHNVVIAPAYTTFSLARNTGFGTRAKYVSALSGYVPAGAVASGAPSGNATGDLCATYPSPTVCKVNGGAVPASAGVVGTDASQRFVAASSSAIQAVIGSGVYDAAGAAAARAGTGTCGTGQFASSTTTTGVTCDTPSAIFAGPIYASQFNVPFPCASNALSASISTTDTTIPMSDTSCMASKGCALATANGTQPEWICWLSKDSTHLYNAVRGFYTANIGVSGTAFSLSNSPILTGLASSSSGATNVSPSWYQLTGQGVVYGQYVSISAAQINNLSVTQAVGAFITNYPSLANPSQNQSSFGSFWRGQYYSSGSSLTDEWTVQNVLGTGSSPTSIFDIRHTGSPGESSLGIPEQRGPATAPTGSCSISGAWVFSQDGHASWCNLSNVWTSLI